MLVSDIMSTCVTECTEDMSLEEVFELIQQCDHRLVVVIDSVAHRVPIGVVTEHSICEQIIARGRNPKSLSAGSVIDSRIKRVATTDLVTDIGDSAGTDVAAIVVIDDNRRVCGLISNEKIKNLPSALRHPRVPAPLIPSPMLSRSARTSEIPAFG